MFHRIFWKYWGVFDTILSKSCSNVLGWSETECALNTSQTGRFIHDTRSDNKSMILSYFFNNVNVESTFLVTTLCGTCTFTNYLNLKDQGSKSALSKSFNSTTTKRVWRLNSFSGEGSPTLSWPNDAAYNKPSCLSPMSWACCSFDWTLCGCVVNTVMSNWAKRLNTVRCC